MPHVIIKMYPGRSSEAKSELTEDIVKTLMNHTGCPEKAVSVVIEEFPPEEWAEKVYIPDIKGKWDQLTKEPGYDPT